MGDSSDNVPGVKGIGEKGAIKLLEEFNSLENILSSNSLIANTKIQSALKNYSQDALLSKKLIQLNTEVDIDVTIDSFKKPLLESSEFKDFLMQYGFKSMATKIFSQISAKAFVSPSNGNTSKALTINLVDLSGKLKELKRKNVSVISSENGLYIYTSQEDIYYINEEEKKSE